MAEITLDIGNGMEIVSVITKASAERLGMAPARGAPDPLSCAGSCRFVS